jgi:ABC-type transport system involved in multi-copper enzyme maturation permease subunit
VLAAKAVVTGAVTFVAALAGVAVTIPFAEHILRKNGNFIAPVSMATELRVALGTAAVFALCSVLALAIGTIVRHGATAVMIVIVGIVLPYLLAVATPLLPGAASDWLLRLTPAAGFAIQQTIFPYAQVANTYTPFNGFFPLAPWAGFAVLCVWTGAALTLATYLLNRRDA